ncbi:MAG TPA: glycosyltransferase [Gemmatimonadaceae bacterium]|nr:glycosyltransferase [Gemmatimonadaceae bacterium]
MTTPRVTIVTASYNQRRFIGACIESVRAQSYDDWEQVVVDDGSTDGTADVAESFGDPRIRVLRLPHRGLTHLAESYNAALAASRGSLVAVLEGDDLWPADKLATQVAAFDDSDVFLSWGRALAVDDKGRTLRPLSTVRTDAPWRDFDAVEVFRRLARTNVLAPAASVMMRRSMLDAVGGFQQGGSSYFVDLATWLTLTARTRGRVRFVNHTLAHYRVHEHQTTQRFGREMDAEHVGVVLDVAARLDGDTQARLGWDTLRRETEAAGVVAAARRALAASDYGAARRSFSRALVRARTWPDRAKAALGLVSALAHVDLLGKALAARASYLSGD